MTAQLYSNSVSSFRPPAKPEYYLEWVKDFDLTYETNTCVNNYVPFLRREVTQKSKVIVKAHPILDTDKTLKTLLETKLFNPSSLMQVRPDTLLFQPPAQKVVSVATSRRTMRFSVERQEGITFGAIIEELGRATYRDGSRWSWESSEPICIEAQGVIVEDSVHVQNAIKGIEFMKQERLCVGY